MAPESLSVCLYDFVAGWGAEYLHAIVASSKEKCAENVDNQLGPYIQISCLASVSFKQSSVNALDFPLREYINCYDDVNQYPSVVPLSATNTPICQPFRWRC
jgi:hypothetical protein